MNLYRFEYEIIENKSKWKANIIGNNSEEAAAFLRKIVKFPINIFSIEDRDKVDGITDEIISKIIQIYSKQSSITTSTDDIIESPKLELKPKKSRMKRKEAK